MTRASRARSGGRAAAAAATAVLACLLAACGGIPTSGPVATGDSVVSEPGPVTLLAYGPQADAEPQAIVRGFLQASAAGSTDNFAVAREYLAGAARSSWDPHQQVIVYSSNETPELTSPTQTEVKLSYPVAATVDADGTYAEAATGKQWESTFELVKNADGQWRISTLPDGVLLSEPNFTSVYRSTSIYFLSKDNLFLVPEMRWFPQRTVVTSAVNALLAGPAAFLRDAVGTAFPDGVTQTVNGVTVDDNGTAHVDLTGPLFAVDAHQRQLLRTQLDRTLLRLPGVRSISVSVAGVPMPDDAVSGIIVDPSPGTGVVGLAPDQLVTLSGSQVTPVPDVGALTGLNPRSPARSDDGKLTVMLSGADRLVLAPTAQAGAVTLLTGTSLLAPSVDRFGWIWTGSGTPGAGVTVVRSDGKATPVTASWLGDRTVMSIRVARDGSRIAVVSSGADGVAVDLAAVVRNGSGDPVQLDDNPVRVGASLVDATKVVWVDESTLAVLGRVSGATVTTLNIVPISGRVRPAPALDGVTSLAAGKGERSLFVGTRDGAIYALQGASSWREVVTGVSDPAFPG